MNETKDQTIARQAQEIREANSKTAAFCGEVVSLLAELAASREKMECGHPKACWTLKEKLCEDAECNADHAMMHTHPDGFYCTVCGELAAIRAECYERAASEIEARFDKAYQETTQFTASRTCAAVVRSLITSTDDAARAERDKAVRPIGLVIERLPDGNFGTFLDSTESICIAIGQTEKDALKTGTARLIEIYRHQAEREKRIRLDVKESVVEFIRSRIRATNRWKDEVLEELRVSVPAEGGK